jgi:hypothetical protein
MAHSDISLQIWQFEFFSSVKKRGKEKKRKKEAFV